MIFKPINDEIINEIKTVIPENRLVSDFVAFRQYTHDETEDLIFTPELVALPISVEEVSGLVKICAKYSIPITPRGAGTGVSGAALATKGGLMISMEKMDKIVEIDEQNLQATVEAGVITENLIQAAAEKNFLYPVDPASKGSCFIGGNVAHGSGGARVVKYGTIREYILNLQVVLASGEIIWTGANTLKNSSGYSLTQLFIGSEGTLGIIYQVVVKLLPLPQRDLLLLASFKSNEDACQAVGAIFRAGIVPSSLEYMERKAFEWVIAFEDVNFTLAENAQAFLLIELDGNHIAELQAAAEQVYAVLEENQSFDVLLADTADQKEKLWSLRRKMIVSIRSHSIFKEVDTVVPRASLPELITGIRRIAKDFGFEVLCFGHAGDGNLHTNIIKGEMSDEDWNFNLKNGIRKIFELTISLGGTVSGEHGIGHIQREYLPIKYSETHIHLMKSIKQVFDPKGILNPEKIF